MPLPFLTADRADPGRGGAAADIPLPYTDRDRWRRPYRPGPWRVGGSAVLLLLASYLLMSTMVIALTGAVRGAAVCLVLSALVIAFALRLLRIGIWVSAQGLRQTGLLSTTTLPWSKVAAVRTVQRPVKWLGLPRTVQGQALTVCPVQGEPLRAVVTDHNADFLTRAEAFERAADVIEAWSAESH